MKLSIILPIYNEEEVISKTLSTILTKVPKFCRDFELLAIDDGSTDKTAAILKRAQKKSKYIKVITHQINKGYGAALKSGITHSTYDWVFFTDADMQFDITEVESFFKHTKEYDFIVGYRKNRADALKRKLVSHVYNKIIRLLLGLKVKDVDCAFKLMRKSAIKKIELYSNSFFVSVELMAKAYKLQFRIKEIGVEHYPRVRGSSTVSSKQIVHTIVDLSKLFRVLI